MTRQRYATATVGGLLIAVTSMLSAQSTRTVQDGVFTEAQAMRGQTL